MLSDEREREREREKVIPFLHRNILKTKIKQIINPQKEISGVFYLLTRNLITSLTFLSGGKTG
jgi:hypothetical protein